MIDYEKMHSGIVTDIRNLQTLQEGRLTFRQAHETYGGTMALSSLLQALEEGKFNADPTPVKDIKVKTQNIVRRNDPETSFNAAVSQTSEKRQRMYSLIHSYLNQGSLTDEELVGVLNSGRNPEFSPSGIRSRRAELVKAGWVRDSGLQATSRAGHPTTVWEIVPHKKN